jgi:hypothetical protein
MTLLSRHVRRHRAAVILAAGFLLCLVGCSPSTGSVSGKVLLNGQPLKGGDIAFIGQPGRDLGSASTKINEDGTSKIVKIATGPVKITVDTKSLIGNPAGSGYPGSGGISGPPKGTKFPEGHEPPDFAAMKARYVKIPDKYANSEQTDLTFEVKHGAQEYTIELKDAK